MGAELLHFLIGTDFWPGVVAKKPARKQSTKRVQNEELKLRLRESVSIGWGIFGEPSHKSGHGIPLIAVFIELAWIAGIHCTAGVPHAALEQVDALHFQIEECRKNTHLGGHSALAIA